jgi:hypothetical protein
MDLPSVSSPDIYFHIEENSRRACHVPKRPKKLDMGGKEYHSEKKTRNPKGMGSGPKVMTKT